MRELALPGEITPVSLDLPRTLTYEKWEETIKFIVMLHRASRFWLGDALNFGECAYGDKYVQAIDLTGLSYGRLNNIAYTCRQVEKSRRRDSLSFEHHTVVAPLPPDEQERWLRLAVENDWTADELHVQIRAARGLPPPASYTNELVRRNGDLQRELKQERARAAVLEAERDQLRARAAVCPECGHTFELENNAR